VHGLKNTVFAQAYCHSEQAFLSLLLNDHRVAANEKVKPELVVL